MPFGWTVPLMFTLEPATVMDPLTRRPLLSSVTEALLRVKPATVMVELPVNENWPSIWTRPRTLTLLPRTLTVPVTWSPELVTLNPRFSMAKLVSKRIPLCSGRVSKKVSSSSTLSLLAPETRRVSRWVAASTTSSPLL